MNKTSTVQRIFRIIVKEPLFHFLLIGLALFLLYEWQRPVAQVMDNEIFVTSADVTRLLSGFEQTWQRPPTELEMNGVIENFVCDEIYYREARALGLDQDDVVVRRRLRQKLEFIMEDVASQVEPSDEELTAFMARSPEKYMFEPKFSFHQVYLDPTVRGEQLENDITGLLTQLNKDHSDAQKHIPLSDPSLLPPQVNRSTRSAVVANFGETFVQSLEEVAPGSWSGPIESSLGTHLVLLLDYQEEHLPALAEIRKSVRNDWLMRRRDDYAEKSYRGLREGYRVTVESPAPSGDELALNEQSQ